MDLPALFEAGLAYRREAAVNWCPNDATVLANEQVIDGRCERCGAQVELRQLEQWFLRITDYAQRLLDDLDTIDWPEHVKTMQRNWIGRSEGAEVIFRCEELGHRLPGLHDAAGHAVRRDVLRDGARAPDVARLAAGTEHEAGGARLRLALADGARAGSRRRRASRRPASRSGAASATRSTARQIPMFVADYVLMEYGTGAIMAVPAHDERDYEFATAFGLPVRRVIEDPDGGELPYTRRRPAGQLATRASTGCPTARPRQAIIAWLEQAGRGRGTVNFRLRDWLISRQRYWGCPIPIVYCPSTASSRCRVDQLPVLLPDVEDYAPKGRSPLAAAEDWVATTCPICGGPARRETDTMDTFVDSSWYFLRYCDAANDEAAWDPAVARALDAGRPVHRRRRARDPAPDVRALLHQGARGPRPARPSRSRSRPCSPRG